MIDLDEQPYRAENNMNRFDNAASNYYLEQSYTSLLSNNDRIRQK